MQYITQEQAEKLYELLREIYTLHDYALLDDLRVRMYDLLSQIGQKAPTKDYTTYCPALRKPTNGDRWRAMSDEQIAEIIQRDGCCSCPVADSLFACEIAKTGVRNADEFNDVCKAEIVKWLGTEAK